MPTAAFTRIVLLLAIGLGCAAGCGGFDWRLQSTGPTTPSGAEWTSAYGAPLALRVDGDTLYVAAERGLYALGAGGQKRWATGPLPPARRALTVGEGRVVVSSYESRLPLSERSSGQLDGRKNGHLTAYRAVDGAQAWDQPSESAQLSSVVIGHGRAVFISNNLVVALDLASGAPAWRQPIAADNALMRAIPFSRVAPALVGGKVCAALAWELNVLEAESGNKGPHEDATGGGVSASVASDGATCYFAQSRVGEGGGFGAGSNTLWAVEPGRDPEKFLPRWTYQLGDDDRDRGVSNVLVADGTVYGVTNFRVVALDAASGKLRWTVRGRPVAPVAQQRGTRQSQAGGFAFDSARGTVFNDTPGTNFAAGDGKIFLPVRWRDEKTHTERDVVTALDAASGRYLGAWDGGGAIVLDLAVTAGHELAIATSEGLRVMKTDRFAAPPR